MRLNRTSGTLTGGKRGTGTDCEGERGWAENGWRAAVGLGHDTEGKRVSAGQITEKIMVALTGRCTTGTGFVIRAVREGQNR